MLRNMHSCIVFLCVVCKQKQSASLQSCERYDKFVCFVHGPSDVASIIADRKFSRSHGCDHGVNVQRIALRCIAIVTRGHDCAVAKSEFTGEKVVECDLALHLMIRE